MNKLKTMLCAVFTLMLVNVSTIALSDSSNFAGPYVGISASGYGIQLSGTSNISAVETDEATEEISLGQVAPVTGMEFGYAVPVGSMFLLDVGFSFFQGVAKLEFHNDSQNTAGAATNTLGAKDVSFQIDDLVNYYIAPTLVLSDFIIILENRTIRSRCNSAR